MDNRNAYAVETVGPYFRVMRIVGRDQWERVDMGRDGARLHPEPFPVFNTEDEAHGMIRRLQEPASARTIMTALALARRFSELLVEELAGRRMREVIDRNKCRDEEGVCASHDFCDANMHMAQAWEEVTLSPLPLGEDDDEARGLWNGAWEIAKAADFFI